MNYDTVVSRSADHVSSDLGGEEVILNLENGVYYGLDPVGAHVWNSMEEPQSIAALRDAVVEVFDTTPEECGPDLLRLLAEMEREGLVVVKEDVAA